MWEWRKKVKCNQKKFGASVSKNKEKSLDISQLFEIQDKY